MSMQIEGIDAVAKALKKLGQEVADTKNKRQILRKAGKPVVESAQSIAPKLKRGEVHYRYNTPKLSNKLRAPKGSGVIEAEYRKGNLAGAIRVLSLRRAITAIIGPKVAKRGKGRGKFGPGTRNFDAYYAQMVFGSAKAFQRRVMSAALQQSKGEAISVIESETAKVIKKEGRKNGLDVR